MVGELVVNMDDVMEIVKAGGVNVWLQKLQIPIDRKSDYESIQNF